MEYTQAGLRETEYEEIRRVLGREPNECELRIMGSCGPSTALQVDEELAEALSEQRRSRGS